LITRTRKISSTRRWAFNNKYAISDTGTTLTSPRLQPKDTQKMVEDGELMVAEDEKTG